MTPQAHDPASAPATPQHGPHDGRHDFDFLYGRWTIRNERLRERLAGSDDWEEFPATGACWPVLNGVGDVDEFVTDWENGFRGMTLRLFNLKTRRWSIYWASNRDGVLEAPVVGRFENGVGTFYGRHTLRGRAVLVRFVWSGIASGRALWEQAFSVDDGASWETNWRMHFTRAA